MVTNSIPCTHAKLPGPPIIADSCSWLISTQCATYASSNTHILTEHVDLSYNTPGYDTQLNRACWPLWSVQQNLRDDDFFEEHSPGSDAHFNRVCWSLLQYAPSVMRQFSDASAFLQKDPNHGLWCSFWQSVLTSPTVCFFCHEAIFWCFVHSAKGIISFT